MRNLLLALLLLGCNRPGPAEVDRTELAFGSYVRLRLLSTERVEAESAAARAFRSVHRLDTLWSVLLPGGDIGRLNESGRMAVAPGTRELVEAAVRFGHATDGALDITVEPLLRAWGFHDTVNRVPDSAELAPLVAMVDFRRVTVDGDSVGLEAGARVDLGAVAVGRAVDAVVALLRESGVVQGLVDAGGDIRVFGDRDWRIGVRHPREPEVIRILTLRDQAVSTSGDYQKFFESGGRRYCHIIDPRSGRPANGCASVTVVAPTTLTADAWSTALFVLGPGGLELMAGHDTLAALMLCLDGDTLVEHVAGHLP